MSPKGGRRPGAGRPRLGDEKMERLTVSLEPADAEIARSVGFGNASQGIRAALRHYAATIAGPQERKTDG